MAGETDSTAPLPFPRESGVLVSVDDCGRELVMHRGERGMWRAYEWRGTPARPICSLRYGLTAEEWAACAVALEQQTNGEST